MDKKFLDKVIDQIVSETTIDYDRKVIETPFPHSLSFPLLQFSLSILSLLLSLSSSFLKHCEDVYGLNEQETEYVWKEYRKIIKDKIENNG